jgi:hypothetical protein
MKPQNSNAEILRAVLLGSLVILPRFIDIDSTTANFSTNQRKTAKITGKNFTVYTEL